MIDRDFLSLMRKIIQSETLWHVPRIGKVKDVSDPKKKARILVTIPSLVTVQGSPSSEDNASLGFWCSPRDKNSLTTPAVNDWVEVTFLDGNRDLPRYSGLACEVQDMLPKNYDGRASTHIVFEDPENKVHVKYDQITRVLEIGNSDMQFAARLNDQTLSNNVTDPTFWAWIVGFLLVFKNWVPVVGDGGGALKTALTAFFVANPDPSTLTGKINSASDQVKIGKM